MIQDNFKFQGVRIADESIYLHRKSTEKPKELFKPIISLIKNYNFPTDFSLCDVGCAAGEFLSYARTIFPHCSISGLDFSESLITEAKKKIPDGEFFVKSIDDKNALQQRKFDVINMKGVLTIFDNPQPILLNCLSAIKKNGLLIITNFFNSDPIDLITRYRRADNTDSPWEKGWNMHSCFTVEKLLKEFGFDLEINWHDFVMPFPIERQSDPMRTWTTQVGDNPYTTINGACQIINTKILEIHVKKTPSDKIG